MTTFTDDFTRANADPVDGSWTTVTSDGNLQIVSNAVTPSNLASDSAARVFGLSFAADQESSAICTATGTAGGGPGIGVAVRIASGARTYYRFVTDHGASNNCQLSRFDGGVNTDLDAFTQSWSDGARWRLRVVGTGASTILTMYLNDVLMRTYNDTASAISSGAPGMAYSSTLTAGTLDDFIATDVLSADDSSVTFGGRQRRGLMSVV